MKISFLQEDFFLSMRNHKPFHVCLSLQRVVLLVILLIGGTLLGQATVPTEADRHGWPTLKSPKKVIVCTPGKTNAESMLLQSLSGLAAQAVNEDKFDEMVWVDTDGEDYKHVFEQSCLALNIRFFQKLDVWTLLEYLTSKGIVKGYVTYHLNSEEKTYPITDYSCNVATVYCSLLSGVLVDSSIERKVQAYGLHCLKDARKESITECFRKNKKHLNNVSALSVHPSVSNMRDFAIAHKLMLYADERELIESVLKWVRPLSPILGWGCGDEFDATSVISEWGHYNTASDWCHNLPFLSAAAPYISLKKAKSVSLNEIDFTDSTYVHSFVMSDGDNMQWTIGGITSDTKYMGHQDAGDLHVNWTLCPINLSVISPATWNRMVTIQHKNNSIIEYGAGYQYPDLFGVKRENRKELLRLFAERVNKQLKKLDVKIFGALFQDLHSKSAQEALQIYVEEMEDITGIIAIQYHPYELGKQVLWFKNKKGISVPVITADYALWDAVDINRPHCGTPEYIASLINRETLDGASSNEYSWTIVHAWSDFQKSSAITEVPSVGVNPIKATESHLLNSVRVVSLEELLWRVRMKYHPEQVKSLMK